MILSPSGNIERRLRDPNVSRSFTWPWSAQLPSSHGFTGLVSCLDQLGLHFLALCVQETQSPLMSSLPVDQPFRYDGPFGSHGREAGFLLHSSTVASPIPETPTHSPFAGVSSRALFVSAPFMRHMLALPLTHASNSGAHLQPQSVVSRSSTQASRFCSRETPTFGSPFSSSVVYDRLMHLFCPLCMRSCSLIPWCFATYPPSWCCSGHHSLFAISPRLRHCPLWFQLLFICASLLPRAFFRPQVVLLSS